MVFSSEKKMTINDLRRDQPQLETNSLACGNMRFSASKSVAAFSDNALSISSGRAFG
jgi:hypothetical protein